MRVRVRVMVGVRVFMVRVRVFMVRVRVFMVRVRGREQWLGLGSGLM